MTTNRADDQQVADNQATLPQPVTNDLNSVADPVYLWGRVAAEYSECWAEFFKADQACCEHNWPPLDEDDTRCLMCGLEYCDWSVDA
ncbi:hypothetical protein ACLQ29_31825 [Micromonospora sp. DT228]|uniref:hypothetical protein n=1 Tax=Micromonospora sp. DT228 TaxID=3393443 RepID=UPI003CEB42D1